MWHDHSKIRLRPIVTFRKHCLERAKERGILEFANAECLGQSHYTKRGRFVHGNIVYIVKQTRNQTTVLTMWDRTKHDENYMPAMRERTSNN